MDEGLGKEGIAQTVYVEDETELDALDAQLINWLGEQEAEHRFLLYETDQTLTPWTRRAIRQADHVLVVGHSGRNPRPGVIEQALGDQGNNRFTKPRSLVLLHRGDQGAATGTALWLAERQVQEHYHVRWHGGDSDFARLARILAGQAVGLVLSGGGARGVAHLGVLCALEEADIPVDLIGGVSAGSVIGGLYAMGYTWVTIQQLYEQALQSNNAMLNLLGDLTLPVVSFTTGRGESKLYMEFFGDLQIEDLYLPYFCGSANLSQARDYVHRTGHLGQAIRASSTVPGIAPPVVHEGDLLIDGGLYNNLPVDAMRTRNPYGTVIGVDVMAASALDDVSSYGSGLSGWLALKNWFSPQEDKGAVPNIVSLLVRTLEVSSVQRVQDHLASGLADLYLRPPVDHFGFFEYNAIDDIIEAGYLYTKEQLANWQR